MIQDDKSASIGIGTFDLLPDIAAPHKMQLKLLDLLQNARERQPVLFTFLLYSLFIIVLTIAFLGAKFGLKKHAELMEKIGHQKLWIYEYQPEFNTSIGRRFYDQMSREVFEPMGYRLVDPIFIPRLERMDLESCETLLGKSRMHGEPVDTIPFEKKWHFSLNRYIRLMENYTTEFSTPEDDSLVVNFEAALEGIDFYGQEVLYVGPQTVVEQLQNISGTHKIDLATTEGFMTQNGSTIIGEADSYDVIITSNYLETIGFGKYGEELEADLDLSEMQRINCLLKRKGLLFISIPLGWDTTHWNQRRVYGRIRLAMLFAGFDIVESYFSGAVLPLIPDLFVWNSNEATYAKMLIVLRKL